MPDFVITVDQLEIVNRVYEIVVEDVNSETEARAVFDGHKYDMLWERVSEETFETTESDIVEVKEI